MAEADLESIERGREIVKSVGIPAQPEVVLKVNDEINQPEPDFKKIADLVNKDVSLAAKAVKIVNSPFFRPVTAGSVDRAGDQPSWFKEFLQNHCCFVSSRGPKQ